MVNWFFLDISGSNYIIFLHFDNMEFWFFDNDSFSRQLDYLLLDFDVGGWYLLDFDGLDL
jgi:hypothetical protein